MRKPFGLYHYHVVRDCLETTYPTVTANHGSRVLKMTAYETTDDEGTNYLFTLAYCNLSTATDNVGSELIHIHRFRGERESKGTTDIDPFPFGTACHRV